MVALAAGCTSQDGSGAKAGQPIRGQVFVQKQPAAGAELVFYPVNEPPEPTEPRPGAIAGDDGSFTCDARPGDYIVTVVWPGKPLPDGREEPEDKLFGKYADPKRSPLRVTIREGQTELEPFRL